MRITGFSNYEIYPETGQVFSYKSNRFIGSTNPKGYWMVTMYDDDGNKHHQNLYRVIWKCVYGEIPKGYEVNHIDQDRDNNSIHNLNLLTHKENVNWGDGNEKRSNTLKTKKHLCKPIIALKDGEIKRLFKSATDVENKKIGKRRTVSRCCVGSLKTAYGYQWKFLDDLLGDWLEEIQDEDMKNEGMLT